LSKSTSEKFDIVKEARNFDCQRDLKGGKKMSGVMYSHPIMSALKEVLKRSAIGLIQIHD
jgi:hypothetical protein